MIRASARQFAQVLIDLSDRYSATELASGLRELLHQRGWSQRLPMIRAALKYQVDGHSLTLEVARSLSNQEKVRLENKLAAAWPDRAATIVVNPKLRAGVRLRIGDRVFDYSLAQTLDQLQQALTEV